MGLIIGDEKAQASTNNNVGNADISTGVAGLSPEELESLDRKTLLRLDLVLVPLIVMLYLLAWLDRANVGNARVVCI